LTGESREIGGVGNRWGSAQIRHDIPGTPIAWSAYIQYNHYAKSYYLTEVYNSQDIPWLVGAYVEHKDVMGLTVRFQVDNIFNGRHTLDRTVYDGYRDRTPIAFFDRRNQLVGPLFALSVKGTF
jgi:hypothetical protein